MRILTCALMGWALALATAAQAALTADNLLLIVNKNVPDGQKLAEHYAQQRAVPDGRIVALDLPVHDNISVEDFDQRVVAPIRKHLLENNLQQRVGCLVTFYGVPLRIPQRTSTPELRAELVSLRAQLKAALPQAEAMAKALEQLAKSTDSSFMPAVVGGLESAEAFPRRAEHAANFVMTRLQQMSSGPQREELETKVRTLSAQLRAPVSIPESTTQPASAAATTAPQPEAGPLTQQQVQAKMAELALKRWDAADRKALRDLVRRHGGIFVFTQVVSAQEQYLDPMDSEAALDNELALLWWGLYPRMRWQANPLNYKYPELRRKPTVMVMRLDGANADQVKRIIDTSIKVEQEGLQGRVVLDSRGISPQKLTGGRDMYGEFDQTIRNLEVLLHSRTKLPILVDDRPALIPPGTVKDCAVYCGWYSPDNYVPSVAFVPGGIGVHIASFEMTTLHNPTKNWCRNMLDAGAVATMGPVSEPYLHAFPAPDEFFPVLFTGQFTLAETYWYTTPLVSWRMAMVGDPLYTPFKKNPALTGDDLPHRMRGMFDRPATAPAATTAPLGN